MHCSWSVSSLRVLAMNCFSEKGNFPPLAGQYVMTAIPFLIRFCHISTFTVVITEALLILATLYNNYTLLAVTNVSLGASIMCLLVVCSCFKSDGLGLALGAQPEEIPQTVDGLGFTAGSPPDTDFSSLSDATSSPACYRWQAFDRPSLVTRPE